MCDLVAAVNDRLIGEPEVGSTAEVTALEVRFEGSLERPAMEVAGLDLKTRRLGGVLLSSPQFLLASLPGRGGAAPALTPPQSQRAAICERLTGVDLGPVLSLRCEAGHLRLRATAP